MSSAGDAPDREGLGGLVEELLPGVVGHAGPPGGVDEAGDGVDADGRAADCSRAQSNSDLGACNDLTTGSVPVAVFHTPYPGRRPGMAAADSASS